MSARYVMGTFLRVRADAGPRSGAAREAMYRRVQELEELLSFYRDGSDLSRINRAAGPVPVRPETFRAVSLALRYAAATDGAFDPTFRSDGAGDYRNVALDEASSAVGLARPGMRLDLGGIGKGFALDLALEEARAAFGLSSAVMDFGGQWLFWGKDGAVNETVRIEDPRDEAAVLGEIAVDRNGSVSTSAQGQRPGHLKDPATGGEAHGCLSATAFAPTGAEAEALSTALFVTGAARAPEFLARFPLARAAVHS